MCPKWNESQFFGANGVFQNPRNIVPFSLSGTRGCEGGLGGTGGDGAGGVTVKA